MIVEEERKRVDARHANTRAIAVGLKRDLRSRMIKIAELQGTRVAVHYFGCDLAHAGLIAPEAPYDIRQVVALLRETLSHWGFDNASLTHGRDNIRVGCRWGSREQ